MTIFGSKSEYWHTSNCGLWGWGLEETSNYQLFVNRAASERQRRGVTASRRQLTGCEDQRWLCLVLGPRMQSVFVTTPRADKHFLRHAIGSDGR